MGKRLGIIEVYYKHSSSMNFLNSIIFLYKFIDFILIQILTKRKIILALL